MRKSILLSVMLLVCTFAFAQTQKGKVQLGGVFSLNKQETTQGENNTFNFQPQAGYFLSDLTSIGIRLNISNGKFEDNSFILESNLFEFGVFARFHKSIKDNFYLFLQPSIALGSGENDLNGGGTTDVNTTTIQVSPGATYFASEKIAIEMRVGSVFYNQTKLTSGGNETAIDSYGILFNLANVSFGASFFF